MTTHLTAPRRRRPRGLLRLGVAVLAAATVGAFTAQAAEAHVRVKADSTTTGSYSALTFRVPNESPTAGTVALEVTLPQDTPFASVSTRPLPGWTATTSEQPLPTPVTVGGTTLTKAVRTVTWKADSGVQIAPGQYQEFSISVGPLPAPKTLVLPATQTYSDGKVVTWDQVSPAGGPEPENPAPAFVITAAATGSATTSPSSTASSATSTTSATTAGGGGVAAAPVSTASTDDPLARWLAGAALVVALVGVGVALLRRRGTSSS